MHDGSCWHLSGTGITAPGRFEVLHATGHQLDGRGRSGPRRGSRRCREGVAAPGVIADGEMLHRFLQSDFSALGGRMEHLLAGWGRASRVAPHPAHPGGTPPHGSLV